VIKNGAVLNNTKMYNLSHNKSKALQVRMLVHEEKHKKTKEDKIKIYNKINKEKVISKT
jgi:hypothetical protein